MSYVKKVKKLGKDICPEGSVIRGRTARTVIKSIRENDCGGGSSTITDLTGTTWLLDEYLGIYSDRTHFLKFTTADGSNWEKFWLLGTYNTHNEVGALTFSNTNPSDLVYTNAAGWVKEEYRTITITGGQHAKDELLILYLQVHAKQIK